MKPPAIKGLIPFAFIVRGASALTLTSSRGNAVNAVDIADNLAASRGIVFAATDFDSTEADSSEQAPRHRRLIAKDDPFNYMRIPKTGSTTVTVVLGAAMAKNPEACEKVQLNHHNFHPGDKLAKGCRSFTVIRNPCERYLSQWDHVKTNNPPDHLQWNSCQSGLDAVGMQALQSPITWAQYLLRNESVRDLYLSRQFAPTTCESMIAMWHQSFWVAEDTYVACLPSMVADFNGFFAKEAPGCVAEVPAREMSNVRAHPEEFRDSGEVCKLAKQLYADDVQLWNDRCGARHGYV